MPEPSTDMLLLTAVVPDPSAGCRLVLADACADIAAQLDDVAADMARIIHEGRGPLGDDLFEATTRMCLANVRLMVDMMQAGEKPDRAQPPQEAFEYGRELARRRIPLEALLTAYRVGHEAFWQHWLGHLHRHASDPQTLAEVVPYCSAWAFGYFDAVSGPLAAAFADEAERGARSALSRRSDEARAILRRGCIDERSSSQVLRYELGARHVAFVIWVDDQEELPPSDRALEGLASRVSTALSSGGALAIHLGPGVMAGWTTVASDDLDPIALTSEVRAALVEQRACVAFGTCGVGVEGFRRSHQEAQTARRVATLTRRSVGARVRFDDIALQALLTNDMSETRQFVERELGPMAADTDAMRRLVATLRVYLEEGGSHVRAARRLSVHENTVTYRVKRSAEILGRPVDEGVLRLHVALMLCETLRRSDGDGL